MMSAKDAHVVTGRRLSHYEVQEKLGAGGMGVVYAARDEMLGRVAAIKVLPPEKAGDEGRRRRFLREAKAASALNHPNIVTIYEVGSDSGSDFIAMELVKGEPLSERLKRGPVEEREAIRYAIQIADALECAHAEGLVHRDLKPGNIMIGANGLIKLLDFGLAKRQSESAIEGMTAPLTEEGAVVGTLAYMAPEQARGEEATPRSDLFSFGVVLYEMVAGERPFRGNSQVELFHEILFGTERELTEIDPRLARLIGKALSKAPEDRQGRMGEIAAELRSIEASYGERPARRREMPWRWVAAVCAVVGVAAGAARWGPDVWRLADSRQAGDLGLSAPEYISRGRALFDRRDRKGNLDKAAASFEAAIREDPRSAAAYAGLADVQMAKHLESPDELLLKQAERTSAKALELNDRLAAAHGSRGWYWESAGKREEAMKEFERALDLDPANAHLHLRAAATLRRMRRFDEALRHIERARELAPRHWEPYSHLGTLYGQRGQYEQAAEALRKACEFAPDHAVLQRNLGAVEFGLGHYEEARAAFQRSLEAQPNAPAFSNLGTYYYYTQRYAEAVDAFQKALETDANDHVVWTNLGDALRAAPGSRGKALEAHRHALRLAREVLAKKSGDVALRCRVAALLAKTGDLAGARSALGELAGVKVGEPDSLFNQAVAYELVGERERALEKLRAAVEAGLPGVRLRNEPEFLGLRGSRRYQERVAGLLAGR